MFRELQEDAPRAESFGLIAIEAMACGSVVIMSDGHVSPELINHGVNGFRIDFNEKMALVDLFKYIQSQGDIEQLSIQAQEGVQIYRIDRALEQNLKYYKSILKN